jgi:hypothetical protein
MTRLEHQHQHHQLPLHRLWAAWLAVLLVLFAALAPTVSHAIAVERGAQTLEICTSTGAKSIPADSPTGPESALHLDHCPFCLHAADRVAPPPTPVAYLFLVQGGQQEAMVWQAFFYAPHPYPKAAPRGPPSLF